MTPTTAAPAAPPVDPVWAALDDPDLRTRLREQAICRLDRWLADMPRARRQQEADEITTEAIHRAWVKRAAFDSTRCEVGGWVHGIMVHVLSEHCRKLRKLPVQPPADPEAWGGAAEEEFDEPPFDPTALLDFLPPDDRAIVEGIYLGHLSHRQIADRLGIREGTARARLRRALAKLRPFALGGER